MRFMAELTINPILYMYARDVTKYSKLDQGNECLRITVYLITHTDRLLFWILQGSDIYYKYIYTTGDTCIESNGTFLLLRFLSKLNINCLIIGVNGQKC